MPANRSRTERWRDCLHTIYERGGGLEFAVNQQAGRQAGLDEVAPDLVWRVRVLGIEPDSIRVECPGAMGTSFRIGVGTPLVGIMAVGQNKWMFHTEVTDSGEGSGGRYLRVRMPTAVERCQRRAFDRISTASVTLPPVEAWPLLDPRSAVPAEVANRVQMLDMQDADVTGRSTPAIDVTQMPEVGPVFKATLANLGGGGVGLRVARSEAGALDATRIFWLRIDLRPVLPAPLALTARLAHTHFDSQQDVYAGMAFDFGLNPSHKTFVIDQIQRYLTSAIPQRKAA